MIRGGDNMTREFNRNMFVMLFSIMVGAIIITYFAADVSRRGEIETLTEKTTELEGEIKSIEEMNINFTNYFMKSTVLLEASREDRAFGDYHFDLAFLGYNSMLSEDNEIKMNQYKNMTMSNCTNAMEKYLFSHDNFGVAENFFVETKAFTN